MTYGVYFFEGNGQVVPARRQNYRPVALNLTNMTDAISVRAAFQMLHPGRRWIACDERFEDVKYGFHVATAEELRSAWATSMERTKKKLAGE